MPARQHDQVVIDSLPRAVISPPVERALNRSSSTGRPAGPEDEQVSAQGIPLEHLLDQQRQPRKTLAHIGMACRQLVWFTECGVETVAIESTSVYRILIFELLEACGFTVFLVNARDAKHVPGRKTDVSDAQWLHRLHSYGLLSASFRPNGIIIFYRPVWKLGSRHYTALPLDHWQTCLLPPSATPLTGSNEGRSIDYLGETRGSRDRNSELR
jgi:hypothetical protein